jgi:hypothetical protein
MREELHALGVLTHPASILQGDDHHVGAQG